MKIEIIPFKTILVRHALSPHINYAQKDSAIRFYGMPFSTGLKFAEATEDEIMDAFALIKDKIDSAELISNLMNRKIYFGQQNRNSLSG